MSLQQLRHREHRSDAILFGSQPAAAQATKRPSGEGRVFRTLASIKHQRCAPSDSWLAFAG